MKVLPCLLARALSQSDSPAIPLNDFAMVGEHVNIPLLFMIVSILVLLVTIEIAYYMFLIPEYSDHPLHPQHLERYIGKVLYVIAHVLSPLRFPLGIIPYITKTSFVLLGNPNLNALHTEVFRLLGDFVNLGLTIWLILLLVGPPSMELPVLVLYIPVGAEIIRLLTERGQMIFSGGWQLLPHRRIALALQARREQHLFARWTSRLFARYCRYYALSDEERAESLLLTLKRRAMYDVGLSRKLEYVRRFRIIEADWILLAGKIRDVAHGEVFITRRWTNDPWLLIGIAMRRSPWIFDPRFLQRPFYYRTQSARLVAQLMFKHARYCPPFIIYQFGHEIKDARYAMFFGTLHALGIHLEGLVCADGTYAFDPLLRWFKRCVGLRTHELEVRSLWTDDEVVADVIRRWETGENLTATDIAEQYTYPIKYIEEVLVEKISSLAVLR